MSLRVLRQMKIKKRTRVIVRADFDVTFSQGVIVDDFRIREVLPTLRFLLARGAKIRIISHLGRPEGRSVPKLSLKPVVVHLEHLLKKNIAFIPDPFLSTAFDRYNLSEDILFFENIRFWPGEEKNSVFFARNLARWGDYYVNEAFAAAHRAHASMAVLPRLLPSLAGFHFEEEVQTLGRLLEKPTHPFVAILGGAKLETKLPLIRKFLKVADMILIGGALGATLFQKENLLVSPFLRNKKLVLPVDAITRSGVMADIGPKTIALFTSLLKGAKTIIWNGPLGIVEIPKFRKGTKSMARILGGIDAFKVVGGGDTLAFLREYRLLRGFSHVSSGGGAMLEFLVGKKLPGIEVLKLKT